MKIKDIIREQSPVLSFEVFPPKTSDAFDTVKEATEKIAALSPSFMSVTYGAAGTTAGFTLSIAENLLNTYGVTPLAHMTCVCSDEEKIAAAKRLVAKYNNPGKYVYTMSHFQDPVFRKTLYEESRKAYFEH